MPLPALGELPQLTALSLAWRRLVDLKPVLMLVNNTGLVCCWEQRGRWQQRVVGWPEGVCRDGVPLKREVVGELIADLIFDCDCPGAELVLCLLLMGCLHTVAYLQNLLQLLAAWPSLRSLVFDTALLHRVNRQPQVGLWFVRCGTSPWLPNSEVHWG